MQETPVYPHASVLELEGHVGDWQLHAQLLHAWLLIACVCCCCRVWLPARLLQVPMLHLVPQVIHTAVHASCVSLHAAWLLAHSSGECTACCSGVCQASNGMPCCRTVLS